MNGIIGQITEALIKQPGVRKILSIEPDARFCGVFRERLPGQPLIEGTMEQAPLNQSLLAVARARR